MKSRVDVRIVSVEAFRFASPNPLELAEVLARRGLSVRVCAPACGEAFRWNVDRGFEWEPLDSSGNAQFIQGCIAYARQAPARVTVAVNCPGLVAGDILTRLRLSNALVYYALELATTNDFPRSFSVRWQTWRARAADLVVTTGPERAEVLARRCRLPRMPLSVANSPLVRQCDVGPQPATRASPRELVDTRVVAVYAGSAGTTNRLTELVESLHHTELDLGLVLHAFGGSPEEQSRLREAIRSVEQASSKRRVALAPSVDGPRAELIGWLRDADIGVAFLDYRKDPSLNVRYYTPNKLLDYWGAGLAALTSDNPNLLRDVEAAGLGACVDPSKPEAIARGFERVVEKLEATRNRVAHAFATEWSYDVQAVRCADAIVAMCARD